MITICIVGTHQSGSTRLFNLVRLIYEKKEQRVFSGWNIEPTKFNDSTLNVDVILSKIHDISYEQMNNYDIKLLPLRNVLDSALSARKRRDITSTNFFINDCIENIALFNKFKPYVNFIFIYENYSVHYIKQLGKVLNINLNVLEIMQIMKKLDEMHNNKSIVKVDDDTNTEYRKTLLSQSHNTSNGKNNKFIHLSETELATVLYYNNHEILNFLKENNYF